jgi:methionine-rich copper-binding protein CopC
MNARHLVAALALIASLVAPSTVQAHAFLDHADPAVGSTDQKAPAVVHIWFTQELEPAFSWIKITDKSGNDVSDGASFVDPGNKQEMNLKLRTLPAGTYSVKWHALSVDTHTTEGDFTFQVKG